MSLEELKAYDGKDPKKPLLMAIKGRIYDVSQSTIFYGPGGPYELFAAKDASRALAKMSFEDEDLNGDLTGLGPFELDALQDWEYKFISKYVKVGSIINSKLAPLKSHGEGEEEVHLGDMSLEELKAYDGKDPKKPLFMAIKCQIYDVSQSRMFYGPDGPYGLFAAKDASRALAKMSFEDEDLNGDLTGLGPFELEALQDREYKFMSKYVKVGSIINSKLAPL